MDWKAFARRNADVIVGFVAWYGVGQFVGQRVSPDWGGVTLVASAGAGIAAYLAMQWLYPESRGA